MRAAISGGRVVLESGVVPATVTIADDGTIDAITSASATPPADEVIDATGLFVFPGAVDPHSHLNDPGQTASEDLYTGTCAAAAGGVTTVLEMPSTSPIVINLARFREKLAIAQSKSVVDFGLWGALTTENVFPDGSSDMREMAEAGAIAFKAFTSDSVEQPKLPDTLLATGMREAADLGLIVAVHSEDQTQIDHFEALLKQASRNDALINPDSRPLQAEAEAVRRVIALGELIGCRFHIVHVSHPAVFELVRDAQWRGARVTAETCPHYLTLTRDAVARVGSLAMCNPPLRDEAAREGLWALLERGLIPMLASDHSAYTVDEKENPNFWEIPSGISGMQVMFPMIVGGAARRGMDLRLIAAAFSGNAARTFGLHPRKGIISPGSDADLALVDLDSPWTVRGADLFTKAPGTPYEGLTVRARVRRTLVRGQTVYVDDTVQRRILMPAGSGEFLRPTARLA
jgi:allantoinase